MTRVGALSLAMALAACGSDRDPTSETRMSVLETLARADTAGYARAFEPRPFEFPADHGPHPSFRTEWWYVTGNLTSADARDYGFQLTIFRSALAPRAPRGFEVTARLPLGGPLEGDLPATLGNVEEPSGA